MPVLEQSYSYIFISIVEQYISGIPSGSILKGTGFSQLIAGKINANVDRCSLDSQDKANSINYVKSSVLAHFAAGGSSNSVILDAHVVERENQFLAAEADDEAAEDLCYALERFLEGMEEYETIVRRVSQHAAA